MEQHKLNLAHWFTVADLMFLWRGGRVSKTSAWAGTFLNIKPVLHVDDEGHLIPMEKVRGRKKSLNALVDHMEKSAIPPVADQMVFITHGDCLEDAEYVADKVRERFGVRVARLVCEESQRVCGDPCLTWNARKLGAVKRICGGCRAAKIIALSDKLSNMRAISRDFARSGEAVFQRFHQRDKRRHAWYYRSCAVGLRDELGETDAWHELSALVERVFSGVESLAPDEAALPRGDERAV